MKSDIDVLIIFSDKDNEEHQGNAGWVSQFRRFLELMLTQILGGKPNILLKSEFDSLTSPNMDNAASLVCIISEDFARSGRCLDNLEAFYQAAEKSGKNRGRVFKVFKTPLATMEQPPRLRDLIGYEMYQLDTETGEVRDYENYFSLEAEKQYWMKMVDLAYDIFETLMNLKGKGSRQEVRNIFKRKIIYLAETGHDLSVQRNIIKRELQRHGYIVLPNQTLPANYADFEKVVRRDMEEANLSIHLIGSAYGEIPDGTDRSIVDIQHQLAAEKSNRVDKSIFTRLIWISPTLSNASEKQNAFIDNLKRDSEAQESAEVLQTPLEDFKNIIREELLESPDKKMLDETGGRSIYLVHDRIDADTVKPIITELENHGYRVLTPAFEGELMEVRQQHINNLRTFDSAIIFKGKVNDQWVRMKVLDLLKAPGIGRNKPIKGKAVLAATDNELNLDAFKGSIQILKTDSNGALQAVKKLLEEFNN
ncbi:MAG: hypothetical protein MUE95_04860 [Cyclobacteriaceae bacterium]|jgi:hypothetical protein|nr:hypothetical protein [Cyclobacteriaceae bacterium]